MIYRSKPHYRPLARIRVDGYWLSISPTGRLCPNVRLKGLKLRLWGHSVPTGLVSRWVK
jgi:hypothetical protein